MLPIFRSSVSKIKVIDIDLGTDCNSFKIYKGSTEINLDEKLRFQAVVRIYHITYDNDDIDFDKGE